MLGSHSLAQDDLILTVLPRLASHSQQSCLNLSSARSTAVYHQSQQKALPFQAITGWNTQQNIVQFPFYPPTLDSRLDAIPPHGV